MRPSVAVGERSLIVPACLSRGGLSLSSRLQHVMDSDGESCRVQRVALPDGTVTWTVLEENARVAGPAEEFVELGEVEAGGSVSECGEDAVGDVVAGDGAEEVAGALIAVGPEGECCVEVWRVDDV